MAAVGTSMRTQNAGGISRLALMQERMRENLKQEKESRMLELVARQEADREERINRVKGSSSSNTSLSSSQSSLNFSGAGQGRVRRMLEERRNNPQGRSYPSPKGIDKSYPLEPVKKEAAKPPQRRGAAPTRGVSVDRAPKQPQDASMSRSKSQFTLKSNGTKNSNLGRGGLGVPQKQFKSTSSLLDGGSRGPSPGPSSTKSSPGPRAPAMPSRKPPAATTRKAPPQGTPRKPPPVSSRDESNSKPQKRPQKLTVNGYYGEDDKKSPVSPTQGKSGLFSKIGLNFNKSKSGESQMPVPPPRTRGIQAVSTKRSPIPPPAQRKPQDNMPQCKTCGRTFAEDRIEKHQQICSKSKNKSKKRKVFDPAKMRTRGTEAEKYVLRGDHKKPQIKPKKKDWRKAHQDLIQTLRAAKGVPGAVAPPTDTSDYIKCPHCGRKFNQTAADRHIPKCADIKSNKRR